MSNKIREIFKGKLHVFDDFSLKRKLTVLSGALLGLMSLLTLIGLILTFSFKIEDQALIMAKKYELIKEKAPLFKENLKKVVLSYKSKESPKEKEIELLVNAFKALASKLTPLENESLDKMYTELKKILEWDEEKNSKLPDNEKLNLVQLEKLTLAHFEDLFSFLKIEGTKKASLLTPEEFENRFAKIKQAIFIYALISMGLIFGQLFLSLQLIKKDFSSFEGSLDSLNDIATTLLKNGATLTEQAQNVSENAVQQAKKVQEAVADLSKMRETVDDNSNQVNESSYMAEKAHHVALEGRKAVEDMEKAIHDLRGSNEHFFQEVGNSNEKLETIIELVQEIQMKTKIINDIAFQTKLLSFNASVEAARAGEHGKGFAVVAEEVGNLASLSDSSAKEIAEMLENSASTVSQIIENSKRTVEELSEKGREKLESNVKTIDRCGKALETIVPNVEEVKKKNQEILATSVLQSEKIVTISGEMENLDKSIKFNSTISKKTVESANELKNRGEEIGEINANLNLKLIGRIIEVEEEDEEIDFF